MERGWGGPLAIALALAVMYLVKLAIDHFFKIDNHSPTEEWIEGEEEFYQLTDARGAEAEGCGGGVVDHGSWRSHKPCTCGKGCDMTPRQALP